MSAAWERGRRVPADLSVVGFDDVRLASLTNPPLTTIAQPKYEMGVLAVTMLLERMRHPEMPAQRRVLETSLVTRRSTAPAGSG
jgi:DNA-binding LacI/PurR family transcriptional regulator